MKATRILGLGILPLLILGAAPAADQPKATPAQSDSAAIAPAAAEDSAPILGVGSRALVWYGGAPQLRELHEHFGDRLAQLKEGVVIEQGQAGRADSAVKWREPYDLLVLLAADQEELDEWREVAPDAWVVLSVTPVEGPEQVHFVITFNFDLESKPRPRVVSGSGSPSELLAELDSLEAQEAVALPESDDEGAGGAGSQARPGATVQKLRSVVGCIAGQLAEIDVTLSVTYGAGGQVTSFTISISGTLAAIYNALDCF